MITNSESWSAKAAAAAPASRTIPATGSASRTQLLPGLAAINPIPLASVQHVAQPLQEAIRADIRREQARNRKWIGAALDGYRLVHHRAFETRLGDYPLGF